MSWREGSGLSAGSNPPGEGARPGLANSSQGGSADIVQFSCPLYFAEESEGKVNIEVMRLGSLKGEVSVNYRTEDVSAKAGERYEQASGKITFLDGESNRAVQVNIILSDQWCPTLEFKIRLTDPDNCYLGLYLQSCTVKVIDDDVFPSSKYIETISKDKEGVRDVDSYGLFYEFLKMNFNQQGIYWKTYVTLCFDQLFNLYIYLKLIMNAYIVNVVFNTQDEATSDHLLVPGDRVKTATIIGAMYIIPLFFLHAWDYAKIKLDIEGYTRVFLSSCLFRKYLNYSEESRSYVAPAEMQLGLLAETADLAEGYTETLALCRLFGKLIIMIVFVVIKDPGALWMVILMPILIGIFGLARGGSIAEGRREKDKKERELIGIIAQTCEKYTLVKNYFRRSARAEMYAQKADQTRASELPVHVVMNNNLYASRWLGPIFIGIYIVVSAPLVLSGELALGFFLATISILDNMSGLFLDVYKGYQKITEIAEPLMTLSIYYNLETDLRPFKKASEAELKWMHEAREDAMKRPQPAPEMKMMRTDLIPIQLDNLSFNYGDAEILSNCCLEAPQGAFVGIGGSHGSGKSTLCHLLGGTVVPDRGHCYVPPHLRVLFVAQEPTILLDLTLWENLTMGCPNGIDEGLVTSILSEMGMDRVIQALEYFKAGLGPEKGEKGYVEKGSASDRLAPEDSSRDLLLPSTDRSSMSLESTQDEMETPESGKKEKMRKELAFWFEKLNYTQKAKIHLARAFIMNPEVMVMLRPLYHFDEWVGKNMLTLIQQHHKNRGLCMPLSTMGRRRPRTVFMTCDTDWQECVCDTVWHLDPASKKLQAQKPPQPPPNIAAVAYQDTKETRVTDNVRQASMPDESGGRAYPGSPVDKHQGRSGSNGLCVQDTWMSDLCFTPKSNLYKTGNFEGRR